MIKVFLTILLHSLIILSCGTGYSWDPHFAAQTLYEHNEKITESLSGKTALSSHEHYVLARTYKKNDDLSMALFHYTNAAFEKHRTENSPLTGKKLIGYLKAFKKKSPYYNDALYHIAELHRLKGDYETAITTANLLDSADTPVFIRTLLTRSLAHQAASQTEKAEADLLMILEMDIPPSPRGLALIRLGSHYQKHNLPGKAATTYERLLTLDEAPSWQKKIGAEQLFTVIKNNMADHPPTRLLPLVLQLMDHALYTEAAQVMTAMKDQGAACLELKKLWVTLLIKQNDHQELRNYLTHEKNKTPDTYEQLALQAAQTYSEMNNRRLALIHIQKLKKSSQPVISQKADRLESVIMFKNRKKGYEKRIITYALSHPQDSDFGFYLGKVLVSFIQSGKGQEHIPVMQYYLDNFSHDRQATRIYYWYYRYTAETEEEKYSLASNIHARFPHSIYTWLILESLADSASLEKIEQDFAAARTTGDLNRMHLYHALLYIREQDMQKRNRRIEGFPPDTIDAYNRLSAEPVIDKQTAHAINRYLAVGAINELQQYLAFTKTGTEQRSFELMFYLGKRAAYFQNYYLAGQSVMEALKLIEFKEDISMLPRDVIAILYPRPFNRCVTDSGKKYSIDEATIYSVMKAESSFRHTARSPAGAVGLMQIMPATARDIARRTSGGSYDLTNPCLSIEFGTYYLNWLNDYLGGTIETLLAGYNAGPGNARRWSSIFTHHDDLAELSEKIPFNETRVYLLKTARFRAIYRILYQ